MKALTVREIRRQKVKRMKTLLDAISEEPRTFEELKKLLESVGRQNIYNYLYELRGLGLIVLAKGRYCPAGSRRKVYTSRHNYDIALAHSKRLVQRLDAMTISQALAIDKLAFNSSFDVEGAEKIVKLFRQHLRTGYTDVYRLLKKYREKLTDAGYADLPRWPKLSSDPDSSLESSGELEELTTLQKGLIGEIYFIISNVTHGIPLQGYCDSCPDHFFTIKDKS